MKLSEFELDVMELFWREGGVLSTSEVHAFIIKKKTVAYTTVKTIIDRLEDKGALVRTNEKKGRSLIYQTVVSPEQVSSSWIPGYLERFFGGSPGKLITQLISDKPLSREELHEIKKLLEEKEESEEKVSTAE